MDPDGRPPFSPDALRPVDPEVRVMSLGNGFCGWFRHHPRPAGGAMLWLHLGCGSLAEEEEERGAAHFLEHLVFRGSAGFPPGAAEAFFAELGTRLGYHHNAFTGLNRTCVSLTLPDASAGSLDRAMWLLADVAFRLDIGAEEVELQRRVILEEMRARREVRVRLAERLAAALLPGSRAILRYPLGTEATVSALGQEQLRAFYRRGFRPDTSRLLVAGDVAGDQVERLLERHFGGWSRPAPPPLELDPGFPPLPRTQATVLVEPELAEAQVGVASARARDRQRTVAEVRGRLVEGIAIWIVTRRLGRLVQQGTAPFREAYLQAEPMVDVATAAVAVATGPPEAFQAMLAILLTELHRAREHGFPGEELAAAKEVTRTIVAQALVADRNRASGSVLRDLVDAVRDGLPPMSREQRRDLVEELLLAVEPEQVVASIRAGFPVANRLLFAAVPERVAVPLPTAADLLECAVRVERSRPVRPAVVTRPERLVERLPPAAEVVEASEDVDLNLLSLVLGNGVRIHLRPMDYRRRRVFVCLTLAGGRIREREGDLGLTTAAALVLGQPACAGRSSVEILEWLTARALVFTGTVMEDCVTVAIAGDSAELAVGLEVAHALLAAPRLEAPVLARWQRQLTAQSEVSGRNLEVVLARRALELLSGSDPRFRLLGADDAARLSLGRAQGWLDELVRAPLEVAVVGDLEVGSTVELLRRYLGSLPPRALSDPGLDPLRVLLPAVGPLAATVEVEGDPSRAAALVGWRAAPWREVRERRLHELAESILRRRLEAELRERVGLSYVADCSYRPSRAYPAASLLAAAFFASPGRLAEGLARARGVVEELAACGPTDAELESARRQARERSRQRDLDPHYWVQALSDLALRGTDLADLKGRLAQLESFTADDLRRALAVTVSPERRLEVACVPS